MENGCLSSVSLKNKPPEHACTWLCQGGVVLRVFFMPESWVITSAHRSKPNERWDFSFPCHPLTCSWEDAQLLEQQVQPESTHCCCPTNERGSCQRTLYSHAHLLSNAGWCFANKQTYQIRFLVFMVSKSRGSHWRQINTDTPNFTCDPSILTPCLWPEPGTKCLRKETRKPVRGKIWDMSPLKRVFLIFFFFFLVMIPKSPKAWGF